MSFNRRYTGRDRCTTAPKMWADGRTDETVFDLLHRGTSMYAVWQRLLRLDNQPSDSKSMTEAFDV